LRRIPELVTDRLVLRPFHESDLDAFAAMCSDERVMRFLGGKPLSRAETWSSMARMLGHWQLRGYGMWAVEEKDTQSFIGRVGFINPEGWPGFEIGWTLVRARWGHGYATEAAKRALQYGFEQLGRDHIISLIHPENHRSVAVANRLGERYEETIDFLDQRIDVYGIDRQSWEGVEERP